MSKILEVAPEIKGLIFDLDGTIADTMPIHYVAWRNAAARYGIDFSVELFEKLAGIPLYKTVEKLNELFNKNIDPQEMGDAKEAEYEASMHLAQPIEPVMDVIRQYHGKLPMAVGTGGCRYLSEKVMRIVGVDQYIDQLVSADEVSQHKPHPETFLKCAELIGVKPQDCLVFEDGILGMQAAKAAGMQAVNVTNYYEVTIGQ
ncbi:HAD family hydrolase [Sunxiuqinia dokdonensis]|uniref:Phosphatase n=1 Tax=Sunxiuqinia dokdonensis TaxID=1409788 RepID=A0A0L8VF14_9BACT|nr:beta-phosphoglucomutase family hydrolase [Sunxiuqinia dokdonensis]KOH46948.1 phosphatase [Sunxiuqinia dokdonensis]